jgi:hypothetical protein
MAVKPIEKKIVDTFESAVPLHYNYTEFSRLMANSDFRAQKLFYDSMISYITYKAVMADNYGQELDRDSIASVCQYLRNCLVDYFPETLTTEPDWDLLGKNLLS